MGVSHAPWVKGVLPPSFDSAAIPGGPNIPRIGANSAGVKEGVMRALPTKKASVVGLPIGRRRTDWARVGKLGAMGLGALSTAAGAVGARRAGGRLNGRTVDDAQNGNETTDKLSKGAKRAVSGPVSKVSSVVGKFTGSSGGDGEGDTDEKDKKDKKGGGGDTHLKKLRLIIKEAIDVGVPLETAYNQWTQFTELPSIMKGPQNVDQEEDDVTRWVAKIGPSRRRWTATILEQIPDERIVWESTDGTEHRGAVTFHQLDRNLTRVQVEMEYFPHGFVEKVGNIFLAARRRTRKDLRLFKHFLELAGSETGAWRGEIAADDEDSEGRDGDQFAEHEDYEPQAENEEDEHEEPEEYEDEDGDGEDEPEEYEEYEDEEEDEEEPEQQPARSRAPVRRRAPGRPRRQRA